MGFWVGVLKVIPQVDGICLFNFVADPMLTSLSQIRHVAFPGVNSM
jgi:hypothetical protein